MSKRKQTPTALGEVTTTNRGFEIVRFDDVSHVPCSLQASSLAIYEKPGTSAVWLGPIDARPLVMASQAHLFGVKTDQTTGWVPYPIPEQVSLHTRVHLSREQVEALIHHLKHWLETDSFK